MDRARLIEHICQRALDCPPGERPALLDEACGSDAELRAEIEDLLQHADLAPSNFLAGHLVEPTVESRDEPTSRDWANPDDNEAWTPLDPLVGRRLGQFVLERVIATGGMGTVYQARQDRPDRTVAVKVVRQGHLAAKSIRRFLRESEVLGRLNHPGIAQVYEAGVHEEDGGILPYFAMEFLPDALAMTDYVTHHRLDITQRLELVLTVCDALQFAHQRTVIHRDIKPGNILVTPDGRARLIDFGIAVVLRETGDQPATTAGHIAGTLPYMSPEQCAGETDVDAAGDVYSLGVVLYEVLTGRLPYDPPTDSLFDLPNAIRFSDPVRPSSLNPRLAGDLETILLKALEKKPERRYRSVARLAEDLRRFLHSEPILARPQSSWYVLRKAIRRHRIVAAVTAAIIAVTSISAVWLAMLYRTAQRQTHAARTAQALADRRACYSAVGLAHAAAATGDLRLVSESLEQCAPDQRRWEWHYLDRATRLHITSFRAHDGHTACAFTPNGRQILTWSNKGRIKVWDRDGDRPARSLDGHVGPVRDAAFLNDGRDVVSGGDDRTLRIWNLDDGNVRVISNVDSQRVFAIAVAPDGRHFASSGYDPTIKLWTVESEQPTAELADPGPPFALAYAPDGSHLAAGNRLGTLTVWDCRSRQPALRIDTGSTQILSTCYLGKGKMIAVAGRDAAVRIYDAASGKLVETLEFGTELVTNLAADPTGKRLAVAAGAIHSWNLESRRTERVRLGHVGGVTTVDYSADGETLLSGGFDGTVRLWNARPESPAAQLSGHEDFVRGVAVFPDSRRIASVSRDGTLKIWNAQTGEPITTIPTHDDGDQALALSHDGTTAVTGGVDGHIRWHDIDERKTTTVVQAEQGRINGVACSPVSGETASVGSAGTCLFWDDSRTPVETIEPGAGNLRHVEYAPDGRFLALACGDGTIRLWQRHPPREIAILKGHEGQVIDVDFEQQGTRLASAGNDGTVRIWNLPDGRPLHTLRGHRRVAQSVAFLPDGSRVISGGFHHAINIWDPETGTLILTLHGHKGGIPGLAVSPDGNWFVSASNDRTLRIWRAADSPSTLDRHNRAQP